MEELWNIKNKAESYESNDDVLRLLLVERLEQVANLSQEDRSRLQESKNESSSRVVELLRAGDSVFHHVHSVSGIWKTLPMEDQNCEEQAEVDSGVVLVCQIEGIENQKANDKSHLDGKHKNSSVENIHLIVLLKLIFLLVLFHERAVTDGVHVGSQFHFFWNFTSSHVRGAW